VLFHIRRRCGKPRCRTSVSQVAGEVPNIHLERLAKCRPAAALAELVWNALDADASEVRVEFKRNALSGIQAITAKGSAVQSVFGDRAR
jgi:hypothetical protein